MIYCTYFWIQSLAPREFAEFRNGDTYYFAFLNLCCFAPVILFTVYFSIYYLLPTTLARKRYALFLLEFLLLYAVGTAVNYFMAGIFLRHVHYSTPVEADFMHQMLFGNYNTRWGMVIAVIAMGIKLAKSWYLQQKENLEMLKKKNRTEMQLQKARIRPAFLLRSLDTIYDHIQEGAGKEPEIILNLSDLLSYSLYENGKELVPLGRELEQLKNFVAVEQESNGIQMQIRTSDDARNKYIVPLIIIKLLEDGLDLSRSNEQGGRLTGIYVVEAESHLSVKLFFCQEHLASAAINWSVTLEDVKKRLLEYYSDDDFRIELSENGREAILTLHLMLAYENV